MPVNDLAGSNLNLGSYTPEQLFAGDAPIHTDAAKSGTVIAKYEVVKKTVASGVWTVSRVANVGADLGKDYVIAAQPATAAGKDTPYFDGGNFNHALLVWPADLDTLPKRKAFFSGTPIFIGHITP
jgi:hypothetical protein